MAVDKVAVVLRLEDSVADCHVKLAVAVRRYLARPTEGRKVTMQRALVRAEQAQRREDSRNV